jgi:phosphoribosyl-ATP pyrophosphohydrolase/phosphoribosyl-AMP cyclohydrolase
MIIPSIDLMGGQTVQLVGGEQHALDAGDPRPIAEKFGRVGEIAVVDLDAALGKGSNAPLVETLLPLAPCRVGGGIRDVETARAWLDRGATRVVLGTAARPEILRQLPRERVIAALDARHGEVVVEGWQKGTGRTVVDRMRELDGLVGGFLVTFVEREGRLQGLDLDQVAALKAAAGAAELTVAGGVTTPQDVAAIDALGAHAQVGMALYTGRFDLADALAALLKSDRPDGLWPTVVVDEAGMALGLVYSSHASLRQALDTGTGVYQSRSRGLWAKGASSGATQRLVRVALDCDRDALRFTVRQAPPGFCHLDTATCWGAPSGLPALEAVLASRRAQAPAGSYTRRLFDDPALLGNKLREEARELSEAASADEVTHEAADVLYFTLVAMQRAGVSLSDVARVLDARALKISRRKGDAKPEPEGEGT